MQIKKEKIQKAHAIKITAEDNGQTVGRAYLYILYNDLHTEPFGFMEDVFVDEEMRGQGLGKKIVQILIEEAKAQGCYKLFCTARHSKPEVHKMYEKLGFKNHGIEFRIDFK